MINGKTIKIWLMATASCYVLSQVIARRVFSLDHLGKYLEILPMEGEYHIFFEEVFEVSGHVLMIVVSFLAWSLFYFIKKKANIETA